MNKPAATADRPALDDIGGVKARAAVLRSPDGPFLLEDVALRVLLPHEVLVAVAAAGMCRTDLMLRSPELFPQRPVVLGHEGAGVVTRVGSSVARVRVGDHVVMSFDACGSCFSCEREVGTCPDILNLNMGMYMDDDSGHDQHGNAVSARWFAQSSFATVAIAPERSVVVVDRNLPLDVLAPFGCSVSTGVGAVVNTLQVYPGATVVVFGSGAVGMAAIMGARIAGAERVVAVDLHETRTATARLMGATDTLQGGLGVRERLHELLGFSPDFVVDTTGVTSVASDAVASVRLGGAVGLIAGVHDPLSLDSAMMHGKTIVGVLGGGRSPGQLIPALIGWWQQEKLPVELMIKTFPLSRINEAEAASRDGRVIKPVLIPDT